MVSINIPFFNHLAFLKRCIENIEKYSNYPYELVLIDDGSSDQASSEYAKAKADIYIRHELNEGIAKSRADGVMASSGPYICAMDCDVIVMPNWLSVLVKEFDRLKVIEEFRVYILGSMLATNVDQFIYNPEWYSKQYGVVDVPQISTSCIIFEKTLVGLIGNFDPLLYNNLSDLDFSRRVTTSKIIAGNPKVAVTPKVISYHHGFADSKTGVVYNDPNESTRAVDLLTSNPISHQRYLRSLVLIYERWGHVIANPERIALEIIKLSKIFLESDKWEFLKIDFNGGV